MRLLFLHGFQQSPSVIQEETGFLPDFLQKLLEEKVDIEYPTAPFPSTPRANRDPTYSWWPEDAGNDYTRTFAHLGKILESNGPYDGVIGFSQGASVASLTAALLEQPQDSRPAEFSTMHAPFKFVVSFSGYREEDARVQQYYERRIRTPVLHFINSTDPIVTEDRCLRLVDSCYDTDGRVVIYSGSGNHRVPATKSTKAALGRFLEEFA